MVNYIFRFLLVYFVLQANLYAQKKELFCEETLLVNLKNLSSDAFEGRRTGTKGGKKARKYIINEFHKLDVSPYTESFEQKFSFKKGKTYYEGGNVIGYIKGSKYANKIIVISAHYDHEGIKKGKVYNGADDNASGVAALFSFAAYLKNHPPKYSVVLAAFDAEELGLKGSKYFVENSKSNAKEIVLNINMDMISRSCKNELYMVGARQNDVLKPLANFCNANSKNFKIVIGHDNLDELDDWTYSSDHTYFFREGIPFLYFGVEDHEDYHEPTDDYENIHPDFYVNAVSEILAIYSKIDHCFIL